MDRCYDKTAVLVWWLTNIAPMKTAPKKVFQKKQLYVATVTQGGYIVCYNGIICLNDKGLYPQTEKKKKKQVS